MHLLDYIILAVILIWLIAAVCYIIRQKKAGKRGCGGAACAGASCAVCPHRCPNAGVKLK